MNEINIQFAGPDSIPLIQELTLQVWPQTYQHLLTPEQIDYMLEMMYSTRALEKQMQEGQQFLIAWHKGQPLGFASFGPVHHAGEFKLHKLYIVTTVQKSGAGKALLWFVMNEVKSRNGNHLFLQVNRHNENAIGFYQRMGFHFEKEADFDIGNGFYMKDFVMGIHL